MSDPRLEHRCKRIDALRPGSSIRLKLRANLLRYALLISDGLVGLLLLESLSVSVGFDFLLSGVA